MILAIVAVVISFVALLITVQVLRTYSFADRAHTEASDRLFTQVVEQVADESFSTDRSRSDEAVSYTYTIGGSPSADSVIEKRSVHVRTPNGIPYWFTYIEPDEDSCL